jgi:hypothetical protein
MSGLKRTALILDMNSAGPPSDGSRLTWALRALLLLGVAFFVVGICV